MALVPNEKSPAQDSYHALLIEIKDRIRSAQDAALGARFGIAVIENFAKDLRPEFSWRWWFVRY